jgi:hypothetical protein
MRDEGGASGAGRSAEKAPLEAREHLARVLRRAFPLPDSGAFADLVDAIHDRAKSRP